MPGVAMCGAKSCPSRQSCYRYRAIPNSWQSFADFKPDDGKDRCDHFLEIWPNSRVRPEADCA